MTWGIDKGNCPFNTIMLVVNLVSTNVLSDTTCLRLGDLS
jgi:hypothetical protein